MAYQMAISVENPSVLRTLCSLFKSMNGVTVMPQPKKSKKYEGVSKSGFS